MLVHVCAVRAEHRRIARTTHAASLLAPLFTDPNDASELRAIARSLDLGITAQPDADIMQRLVHALRVGRIVFVRAERSRNRPHELSSYRDALLDAAPEKGRELDTRAHWIALHVVDDETARPVADVELVVALPDRSETTATTGADGRVELRSAETGTATVRSGAHGEYHTTCVTFVGTGRAVARPATQEPEQPIRVRGRPVRRADKHALVDVVEHRVRDGDTWESVAERYQLDPDHLMRFNFDTTDPIRIQVAMSSHIGCWRRDPDTHDLVFSDSDEPGVLLIPQDWQRSVTTGYEHILRVRRVRAPVRRYIFSA